MKTNTTKIKKNEEEYKLKMKWGFEPSVFVFLIMITFVLFSEIMGFNPLSYVLLVICITLIFGIIFGSKIRMIKE